MVLVLENLCIDLLWCAFEFIIKESSYDKISENKEKFENKQFRKKSNKDEFQNRANRTLQNIIQTTFTKYNLRNKKL